MGIADRQLPATMGRMKPNHATDLAPARPGDWELDPAVAMLNHGSFGACPRVVLAGPAALREQMEHEPVRFFIREVRAAVGRVAAALAGVLGQPPTDLVFVRNATAGVNCVLRSLRFRAGRRTPGHRPRLQRLPQRGPTTWPSGPGRRVVVAPCRCRSSRPTGGRGDHWRRQPTARGWR